MAKSVRAAEDGWRKVRGGLFMVNDGNTANDFRFF
jgi:hypothetical protein